MPFAAHLHALVDSAQGSATGGRQARPQASSEKFGIAARWSALAALVTLVYLAFATAPSFELWPITVGGRIFNSMLSSLLQGRADIDPALVGWEGYVRDGHTYTYFGIFPALLRLPVFNQLWLEWTTLSCVAAASMATMFVLRACVLFTGDLQPSIRKAVFPALALSLVCSGPSLELLGKPTVYSEAILWSFAATCGFIRASIPWLLGKDPSRRDCLDLALCAAVGLLTRASTGVALYCALAVILLIEARRIPTCQTTLKAQLANFGPVLAVALLAVAATAAINHARWGSPFKFNDFTLYAVIQDDPARLERAVTQGSFNASRVPWSAAYYFAPDWFFSRPEQSEAGIAIRRLFDPAEGPSSQPLARTWILWFTLAAVAAVAGLRASSFSTTVTRRMLVLCSALAIAPLLILSYLYVAFRYRAEFAPALIVLMLGGVRSICQINPIWTRRRYRVGALIGLWMLSMTQVGFSNRAALAHSCVSFGRYDSSRIAPGCKLLMFDMEGSRPSSQPAARKSHPHPPESQ